MTKQEKVFYLRLYKYLLLDAASMCNINAALALKDYKVLENRFMKEGVPFLTEELPRLGKALDSALASENPLLTNSTVGSDQRPQFMRSFWSGLFDASGTLVPEPSIACAKALRQVLYLTYKLELPYDKKKTDKVISSFIQTEEELLSQEERVFDDPVIDYTRRLFGRMLCNFDYREIKPRHGPGAVATGEKLHRKMKFSRIYNEIERIYPFSDYYIARSSPRECAVIEGLQQLPAGTTKVVLVPKDSRGPRLISCEPLEYQWIQQGLGRALMSFIESHPWTSGRVNFADQSHNQKYAYLGSIDRRWATLDMKDASDRVSILLVESVFGNCACLEAFMATRSYWCRLPDGRVRTMQKFAPMGSAMCFPVEALVFWGLLVAVQVIHGKVPLARAMAQTFVYGDDLIVPRDIASLVLQYLPVFGLMLNASKCCIDGFFRESCGSEFFMGSDVKPTRLRSRWTSSSNPENLCAYVHYCNALRRRGFHESADYLKSEIESLWGPIPYVDPSVGRQLEVAYKAMSHGQDWVIPVVGFVDSCVNDNQQNRRLRKRTEKFLQRVEYCCWTVRSPLQETVSVPDGEYLEALASGKVRMTPGYTAVRRRVVAKRRWVTLN